MNLPKFLAILKHYIKNCILPKFTGKFFLPVLTGYYRGTVKILHSQHYLRAGNSTTEGFETVNGNQGHIWPLYPHSTVPTAPRSILRDVQCYIDHGMGSYVFNLIINSL